MKARRNTFILLLFSMANYMRERAAILLATAISMFAILKRPAIPLKYAIMPMIGPRVLTVIKRKFFPLPLMPVSCMQGREGVRETAIFMFATRARTAYAISASGPRVLKAGLIKYIPLRFIIADFMRGREKPTQLWEIFMFLPTE